MIASDLGVYREIVGDLPTYLDAADPVAWADTIGAFAGDSAERERQLTRLPAYRAPTWDDHFAKVDPWAESLPARFGASLKV